MAEDKEPRDNPADPRIYFAAERTLLAWVRTGLTMMGFGFVVARFGFFLRELAAVPGAPPLRNSAFALGGHDAGSPWRCRQPGCRRQPKLVSNDRPRRSRSQRHLF